MSGVGSEEDATSVDADHTEPVAHSDNETPRRRSAAFKIAEGNEEDGDVNTPVESSETQPLNPADAKVVESSR